MIENPYQAPDAFSAPSLPERYVQQQNALEIRQAHIKHEASVKSIGTLYYIGTIFLTLGIVAQIVSAVGQISSSPSADVSAMGAHVGEAIVMIVILGAIAALQGVAGYGIRNLKPWGRIVGIVLSAIGLLAIPVGTIISAYILYLLVSRKGGMVFSPEYKEIIAATPGVKYKTSLIVWIILGIFVLGVIGVFVAGFLKASGVF